MSFVTCRYSGRTGNQLFQAATLIAHAKRNGAEAIFPDKNKSKYTSEPTLKLKPSYEGQPIKFTYQEPKDFTYQPIPYVPDMELIGYFQTEKHFKDYREDIVKAFNFKTARINCVSVHVRRGDYLRHGTIHPVVTMDYLHEAMGRFKGWSYLIFSDDEEWCRGNISNRKYHVHYPEKGLSDFETIEMMAGCPCNIISNSSFSWWGAWLNPCPNKIVIAPKIWFGEGNKHLKTENIVPENWITI